MSKLDGVSDDELRVELKRRDDARAAELKKEKEGRVASLAVSFSYPVVRGFFKYLLPEHSRNSCDDKNPNIGRCSRCTFESLVDNEDWEALDSYLHGKLYA